MKKVLAYLILAKLELVIMYLSSGSTAFMILQTCLIICWLSISAYYFFKRA